MILPTTKTTVIELLKDAESVFQEWTGEEATVDGDARDREPIIAIAQLLWELEHGK